MSTGTGAFASRCGIGEVVSRVNAANIAKDVVKNAATSGLLGDALKYGLPLAGALAGAQGQDNSQSQEKRMDPRLDPYVFGGGGQTGLLDYARKLMEQQMAPGAPLARFDAPLLPGTFLHARETLAGQALVDFSERADAAQERF